MSADSRSANFCPFEYTPIEAGAAKYARVALDGRALTVFGVEGWPACGTPLEALRLHGLDGSSLADRIALALRTRTAP